MSDNFKEVEACIDNEILNDMIVDLYDRVKEIDKRLDRLISLQCKKIIKKIDKHIKKADKRSLKQRWWNFTSTIEFYWLRRKKLKGS